MTETTYYAIGDVHGMDSHLAHLHDVIFNDIQTKKPVNPTVVHLGDYVDHGPKSADVLRRVRFLKEKFSDAGVSIELINILGNHEDLMISAVSDATRINVQNWLINGGRETMQSYDVMRPMDVPKPVIDWLKTLPFYHMDNDNKILFLHAGTFPHSFPKMDRETCIWTRNSAFFMDHAWKGYNSGIDQWLVVHGHTPVGSVEASPNRINVDTGCCFGGKLTCVKINPSKKVEFFSV